MVRSLTEKENSARRGKRLTENNIAPIRSRHYFVQHAPAVLDVDKGWNLSNFSYLNFESQLGSIQQTVESVIYHRWSSYKDDNEAMNDPLVSYGIYNGYIDLDDDEEYEILMNNQYEEDYWCRRYGNYRGSYAQDEMEYRDDDIDTIFDGDPSAYWNID